MKFLTRAFTTLSVVILAACCGALLLFGISGTGWKALAIPTGSMRPGMPPGSLAFVHSVPAASLKIGDVITYINPLNPKKTISHRIIKEYLVDNKIPAYVTKGDANKSSDVPITIGSVEGKVMWHIPYAGYGLLYAKDPIIILPIVYIASLLIMIEEVKRLSDYYKLSQPYRLFVTTVKLKQPGPFRRKLAYGVALTFVFVGLSAAVGPTALAMLKSNTVALADNRLYVAAIAPTQGTCNDTHSNTSISVNSNSSQSSSSGNATVSGNTSGGSALSGNSSNSNSTTTTITITNCR